MLLLMLLFTLPARAEEAGEQSFVLTVSVSTRTVIEPVRIPYSDGQTVKEALEASPYDFDGLGAGGFINAVEGVAGNYLVAYDGGGYDLSVPASEITAISFAEGSVWCGETAELIRLCEQVRTNENHVSGYPAAVKAYDAALRALRAANSNGIASSLEALKNAVAEYEKRLSGPKYTLTLKLSRGEETVNAADLFFRDAYGNETSLFGSSVKLLAGEYSFIVSEGANRTEGSVTVEKDGELSVRLPAGEWIGETQLLDSNKEPYNSEMTEDGLVVSVPDTAGPLGLYLHTMRGSDWKEGTRLYAVYTGIDGSDRSGTSKSWESLTSSLVQLLDNGMEGRSFTLEARAKDEAGHTEIESQTVTVRRYPTLKNLRVLGDGTVLEMNFEPLCTDYSVLTVSDALIVAAEPYDNRYTLCYNGGENARIPMKSDNETITVEVSAEGAATEYTINAKKTGAVSVTVLPSAGATVSVRNAAGSEIAGTDGIYRLIPGESYEYDNVVGDWYHTSMHFTAEEGLRIQCAAPVTEDMLTAVKLCGKSDGDLVFPFPDDAPFTPSVHSYDLTVSDAYAAAYLQADSDWTVEAVYTTQHATVSGNHGEAKCQPVNYSVRDRRAQYLSYLLASCGYGQELILRVTKPDTGDVRYYQEYAINIRRSLHLTELSLTRGEETLILTEEDGTPVSFDRERTELWVSVPAGSTSFTLNGSFTNETAVTPCCGGYGARLGDRMLTALKDVSVALDAEAEGADVTLTLLHPDPTAISTVYTIHVKQQEPVHVTFSTDPEGAVVFLWNNVTGRAVFDEDGVYSLTPGASYSYHVTKNGYKGISVSGYIAPAEDCTVPVTLSPAPDAGLTEYPAQWPSFRADDNNNGVVSARTPITAETAALSWATALGEGWDTGACGCPIIVDDALYTYAGEYLYKVDRVSGKVLASGRMDHSSSFAINNPTYGDGMIFVGLADGTVQAFSAETLEPLWIYRDPLKGQPNCPIVYHDGYIYTGFWLGETSNANFVCLSVADEDPTRSDEEKIASWRHTEKGGFYWAGAYADSRFVLVTTDDGAPGYTTGYAQLYSFDPLTGRVLDCMTLPRKGDARSSVVYDTSTNAYYFTTKGSQFYQFRMNEDGSFTENSLRYIDLDNYSDDPNNPAMSTCSPVVYNGRAYVGVSGTSQFGAYSGHNITVLDLRNWCIAYTVRTQGYPQTSGLLTTAYNEGEGEAYVYFFDNYTPGKLRMLKDRPGMTEAEICVVETDYSGGRETCYDTAYVLFTPVGDQAQYAICSPITDDFGVIYFKNDSGYLMALSPTIEKLEISTPPAKTAYNKGDRFDPAGMQVTAHYANGLTRDVTDYVSWDDRALGGEDTEWEIRFAHMLYQDCEGSPGISCHAPVAAVTLTVSTLDQGDVDGDGDVDRDDAELLLRYLTGEAELGGGAQRAGDMDGDGELTASDLARLYARIEGRDKKEEQNGGITE